MRVADESTNVHEMGTANGSLTVTLQVPMSPNAAARVSALARLPARARDIAIAAVALGGSVALLGHGGLPVVGEDSHLDAPSAVLAACAALPLVAWRRAPLAVFVLSATASIAAAAAGYAPGAPIGPTVALYLFAASRDARRPWTRRSTALAVGLFVAHGIATTAAEGRPQAGVLLHVGLAWAVAWFAGERTRLRREQLAELRRRAHRAERDAERKRDLAAAEERARIARDLHDSAGHAISVIAVKAGAARLRHDGDPARSRRALQDIEELARQTAAEMDAIVSALRDRGAANGAVEAPTGLASIGTLVKRHASAGLDVTLRTTGTPRQLERPVDIAAYRILQEALTNAAKHGLGSVAVDVGFADAGVELTVTNPAHAAGAPSSGDGGHGLVGMRERAALLDGAFDVERVGARFCVRARLPYGHRRA